MSTSTLGIQLLVVFGFLAFSRLATGEVIITEFLASNVTSLKDEDGDEPDWVEIQNRSSTPVDLAGWRLTDKEDNPSKWTFPSYLLQPGERLIVFASDKNRRNPTGTFHTNFKLSADGEYLALIKPNGETTSQFSPQYPGQIADTSYGSGTTTKNLVADGLPFEYHLPDSNTGDSWKSPDFEDLNEEFSTASALGIGYDLDSDYQPFIKTTLPSGTTTVYLRFPFEIPEPDEIAKLSLAISYDDSAIIWLNGQLILNTFGSPAIPSFDSTSFFDLETDPANRQVFELGAIHSLLQAGDNILAVQLLNSATDSDDLFFDLTLTAGLFGKENGYLREPTPGFANDENFQPGPLIKEVTHSPQLPHDSDSIRVTAEILPRFDNPANVDLHFRTMFASEVTLPMNDDGLLADTTAGDGLYTASIPSSAAEPGEMIRWRVLARDSKNRESISPAFLDREGSNQSPQYFGTMIATQSETSSIPTYHWFCENVNASRNRSGARASLFHLGKFYDNIYVRQRGGSSNNSSQKFDFNKDQPFQINDLNPRVSEINLNAQGRDPSYLRQPLSFDTFEKAGAAGPYCFPVQLRLNGAFDRVALHTEQVDDDFLKREKLPEGGALYKFVQRSNRNPGINDSITGIEKKTRESEGFTDINILIDGLKQSLAGRTLTKRDTLVYTTVETTARQRFLFNNLNIPAMVNYLAVQVLTQDTDDTRKNFYLYRDTEGSKEWSIIPWDKDLTFGLGDSSGTLAKHPFWADAQHKNPKQEQWNILFDALHNDPLVRKMILRRSRSLMDQLYKPSSTEPETFFEPRALELEAAMLPLLTIDSSPLLAELNERRIDLYTSPLYGAAAPNLIPAAATPGLSPYFGLIETGSNTANQKEEFIEFLNPHNEGLDLSGWKVEGGIQFEFPGGTVLPAGGSLYLSPSPLHFRSRSTPPHGEQSLFVTGPYEGNLSNRGEYLALHNLSGTEVATTCTAFSPSTLQEFLVISEVHYHPAGNSDAEFIELFNRSKDITLDLAGVSLSGGIEFDFGETTTTLAPGERVVLVRDLTAFTSVFGSGITIEGTYSGALDNSGDRLKLDDATGSTILDFSYEPETPWPTLADGAGHSLVLISPSSAPDPNEATNWQASQVAGGNPGAQDGPFPSDWEIWQQLSFQPSQLAAPLISAREADPDGDGRNNFEEWAFGTLPLSPDQITLRLVDFTENGVTRKAVQFQRPRRNSSLDYTLLSGNGLSQLSITNPEITILQSTGKTETVLAKPREETSTSRKFYQIRVSESR